MRCREIRFRAMTHVSNTKSDSPDHVRSLDIDAEGWLNSDVTSALVLLSLGGAYHAMHHCLSSKLRCSGLDN